MTEIDKKELKEGYINLKDHFTLILLERDKRWLDKFKASDDALVVAKTELDKRLALLNELRTDVVKDREMFLRKDAYDDKIKRYDDWIPLVNARLTVMETRSFVWTAAIAIFFIMINIALHLWK